MPKQVLTPEGVDSIKELLNTASMGIDNLFSGLQEAPTSINDCPECFTKRDLTTIHRAADTIERLRETFDGTRKQR